MRRAWTLFVLLAACSGGGDDDGTPDDGDGGDPRPECDPALAIEPEEVTASPLEILELVGTGGTGDLRFTLVESPSGGSIDERSGRYLAGETGDVTDVVVLEDFGCQGSAEARITVRAPLEVAPRDVELAPRTSFTYEITGGSGEHTCTLAETESGATVDGDCRYTAGAGLGRDRVVVEDTVTGEHVASNVTVAAGAGLRVSPGILAVPVGASFQLGIQGGSGEVSLSADEADLVSLEGRTVRGVAAGRTVVTAEDRFTHVSATLRVDVVAALSADVPRAGDGTRDATILAPGDLDGDGHPDAIVSRPEADIAAWDGGAVLVYHGTADGLDPAPAQVIAGEGWEEELGRGLALGDLDGDGRADLVIGAPRAALGHDGGGAVRIHLGQEDGSFAEEPFQTLSGDWWSDWFGERVAVCDFDGDGDQDLAVAAPLAENRDLASPPNDQGSVLVFLQGDDGGLVGDPAARIFGRVPDGTGGMLDAWGMQLGWGLGAGDVDGDGLCDLVVGTHGYDDSVAGDNAGMVAVYRGDAATGVREEPSVMWGGHAPIEAAAEMGRAVAVGDLDGDGRAEVVAGEWHHDSADNGAVRIFSGRTLSDDPITAVTPADDADWSAFGTAWDQLGWAPVIADFDGDDVPDLLVGALSDEDDLGVVWDAGAVIVWAGVAGALPDPAPKRKLYGLLPGDDFGLAFAVLGAVDDDDEADLAVFAGFDDTLGWDVGRPTFVSGATGAITPLDVPGGPSGQRIGETLAIVPDVDGDGLDDLLVGEPGSTYAPGYTRSGSAVLYRGRLGGSFEDTPAATIGGFAPHGGWQGLGSDVSTAGDFDHDGTGDLAVVGPWTPQPDVWAPTVDNPDECPSFRWRWGSGAVFVMRGEDGGVPGATPAFAHYGMEDGATIQRVKGGFDFDGDQYDDILVSSAYWDGPAGADTGGVALLRGREAPADGMTTVVCEPDWTLHGAGNWWYGTSMAVIGDLDHDGCDEIAIGAPGEVHGENQYWRGAVHVLWGTGDACARSTIEETVLIGGVDWAQVGGAMAAGQDVDGDDIPDLAVAGVYLGVRGDTVGGAWLVSGQYIIDQPRAAAGDGVLSAYPMPLTPATGVWRVEGRVQGEELGHGIALVPGASGNGRAGLAVGGPQSDVSGLFGAGGVRVHRFVIGDPVLPDGLDPDPVAIFGGETDPLGARLGDRVESAVIGGVPVLVTSAPRSDALGLDCGAVYAVPMQ